MKRTVAFLLIFVFIFAFCSCGKDKKETIGTDVEYYAELGQIPELEHKIGDDVNEAVKKYEEAQEKIANSDPYGDYDNEKGGYVGTYENELGSVIIVTGANYYYEANEENPKINRLISLDGGYGFEHGALIIEIKKAMESYGHTADETGVSSDDSAVLCLSDDAKQLQYDFSKSTVIFYFEDSALSAISLTKK